MVQMGAKQANEGESGITLNGDAHSVHSIAVKKFYASPEYAEVLKRQLPAAKSVRLIADKCGETMTVGLIHCRPSSMRSVLMQVRRL